MVEQRLQTAAGGRSLVVSVAGSARDYLLTEGFDSRYGARHLKRAIERLLVQPLSNLLASDQIQRGDCIRVSYREGSPSLIFSREAAGLEAWRAAGYVAA
jgi:ATP-dependent Clp protease ATP-binding subunit ClpA